MSGKIHDVMTKGDLLAKVPISKAFPQHSPELPLSLGHLLTKASSAVNRAVWRMMLHRTGSTTNITPPQPLPIKGRGLGHRSWLSLLPRRLMVVWVTALSRSAWQATQVRTP